MAVFGNNINYSGSAPPIPKNDPNHPRWLLDTSNWKVCQYTDIEAEVHKEGYGILSYTWGKWAKWDEEPEGLPAGLQWKLPVIKNNDNGSNDSEDFLTVARQVVSRMQARYVWWDWMCVPQGNKLSDDLKKVKGEEVSKQMGIYAGAKESIVWLHCTDWEKDSAVRSLLENNVQKDSIEKFVESVDKLLVEMRKDEPWLTSGWTLQEGVLLSETVLLDHHGRSLRNPRFIHNNRQASVLDITAGLTTLAIHIASAFMKVNEEYNGGYYDEVANYITTSVSNYQKIAEFLSRLLRSGLIAYTKDSPLFVLAGKHSRHFSVKADECWALLGALGLGNITPPPDYNQELDQVKATFFGHLLKKHQWSLLLVAGHSLDDAHLTPQNWHTRFADGKYLPLGVFFDVHWKPNLPYLNWIGPTTQENKDAIHMQTPTGKHFTVLRLNNSSALARTYEQCHNDSGLPYIHVERVETPWFPTEMLFFPIADLQGTPNMPGSRCIQIEPIPRMVKDPVSGKKVKLNSHIGTLEGYFRGVIDIWAAEGDFTKDQDLHKLTLFSGV
ncbi:uncharacterized protein APUU_61389S [Aspergillus puulaauensis]|uniref:Heterokaryon incompatibility domain-containing protein n=1 Tax=Aspergillus puulaauensis TaxID=1220207 RepID=A0A7R7XVH8_9EURO|nr:uncharacterized protein APUU_61389S [Aspergillus puulaauensis]BCS28341.1 hypothetical protein APUU_61389S [Aspergillus puulaauensis]